MFAVQEQEPMPASMEPHKQTSNNNNNFNISSILGHLTTHAPPPPPPPPPPPVTTPATTTTPTTNNNDDHTQLDGTHTSSCSLSSLASNGERRTPRHSMHRKQSVFSLDGSPMDLHNNTNNNTNSYPTVKPSNVGSADDYLVQKSPRVSVDGADRWHNTISNNNNNNNHNDNDNDKLSVTNTHKFLTTTSPDAPNETSPTPTTAPTTTPTTTTPTLTTTTTAKTTAENNKDHHVSSSTTMLLPDSTGVCCSITSNQHHHHNQPHNQECRLHPVITRQQPQQQQLRMEVDTEDTSDNSSGAPKQHHLQHHHQHRHHQANGHQQREQQQQQPSQQQPQQLKEGQSMNLQHFKRTDCNLGSNGSSRASSCDEQQAPTSSLSRSTSSELASTDATLDDPDSSQSTKTFTGIVDEPSLPTPQLDTIQKHLRRKSMPNPVLIGQHISNIISQNQAIVDNFNPWTRKNYAPRDSKASHASNASADVTLGSSNGGTTNNQSVSMRKRWSTSSSPRYVFGNNSLSQNKTHKFNNHHGIDVHQQTRRLFMSRLSNNNRNRSSSSTSHEQCQAAKVSSLMESKLESALRGMAHKNLDPQIFQKSDYFSLLADANSHSSAASLFDSRNSSGFQLDVSVKHLQSSKANKINESDLLSNLSISNSKPERMYESVDCLMGAQNLSNNLSNHRDTQEFNDRRYSLNSYSLHPGYDLNGVDPNLLEQVAQNAALLKQLELQQLRLRQLSMMNQQATYNLCMPGAPLENPFIAKQDPLMVNHNLAMRIQANEGLMSNSGLESVESGLLQHGGANLYRDSSVQAQDATIVDHRLEAQQERDQVLMRDFLISMQNNNLHSQQHLIETSQQNCKHLSNSVSNPLSSIGSVITRPNLTSLSCNDDLCKDYSFAKNNQQVSFTPSNERKFFELANSNQINVCNLCKTAFRDWDTLIAHQKHYCRLSIPPGSAHTTNTPQDLVSPGQRAQAKNDAVAEKLRRNSSTLGDLANKVRNVFVTGRTDQLHLPEDNLPARDSKSISPTPLSASHVDSNNTFAKNFGVGQSWPMSTMLPTSPGKQQQPSILKQQLLGSTVTPRQTLPPKKRKISEPNLKFAGFNVVSSSASNTTATTGRRASPDQGSASLLDRPGPQDQCQKNFSSESGELDLTTNKGPATTGSHHKPLVAQMAVDDCDKANEDLYEDSDTYIISKKQCSPTRSTACTSPNKVQVSFCNKDRDSFPPNHGTSPDSLRLEDIPDYVARVSDTTASTLQLNTLKKIFDYVAASDAEVKLPTI